MAKTYEKGPTISAELFEQYQRSKASPMKELVPVRIPPGLPAVWNYDESVEKVKRIVYKWKNMTSDMAKELWIAHKVLTIKPEDRPRLATGAFATMGKTWGDYCDALGVNRSTAYRWLCWWFDEEKEFLPREAPDLPDGIYDVIYADPPWKYDFAPHKQGYKIEQHYPTMELEEICKLDVSSICADDSVLFLWATAPKLSQAGAVLEAWEFEYKTHAIWDKEKIVARGGWKSGYWFLGRHELLLVGTKGNFSPPNKDLLEQSIIFEKRTKHSKKPIKAYEIIESYFPGHKYIELFAREQRDGWDIWP